MELPSECQFLQWHRVHVFYARPKERISDDTNSIVFNYIFVVRMLISHFQYKADNMYVRVKITIRVCSFTLLHLYTVSSSELQGLLNIKYYHIYLRLSNVKHFVQC